MKRDYRIGAWTFEPGQAGVCRIEIRARSRFGIGLRNSSRRKYEGPIEYAACCAMLYDPRPNVTGPRQTTCHDFPDIEPDEPETPVLDDVETPCDDSPLDTVVHDGSPRQDGVQYLVWSCLTKTPIAEMIAELQPHDRDDLRQDMAMKYWRKAVRQELRGQRVSNLTKWLTQDVRQWIGERTDVAIAGPETKAETEEREAILNCPIGGTKTPTSDESAAAQRELSQKSRLAMLDHELRIEQSRFAAEIEAAKRAKQPKAILALKW